MNFSGDNKLSEDQSFNNLSQAIQTNFSLE